MKQNFLIKNLIYFIATVGGSGYSPYAPGTVGSLVAGICFWLVRDYSIFFLLITTIILFFLGIYVSKTVALAEHRKDPSIVVIDEWVGIWLTYLFFVWYVYPFFNSFFGYILLFLLFRFFDIIKPYPIKAAEKISGGFGIMIDDVIAACYAIFMALVLQFFCI